MNTYLHNSVRIAVILSAGIFLLIGVASAQDAPAVLPETGAVVTTANTYITQLDELRVMGQQSLRTSPRGAELENYNFSSDLQALNEMAAAATDVVKLTANDFVTTLDQLRNMAAE